MTDRNLKNQENLYGDECCQQAAHILTDIDLSRDERREKAINFYKKAIDHYKLAGSYRNVADTYTAIAELELDSKEGTYQAASNYIQAGNFYLRSDKPRAILHYKIAVELYLKNNKLSTAARTLETLAHLYQDDSFPEAIASFEKAFKYYEMEDSSTAAYRCLLELAYLLISSQEYEKALVNLEKVINYYSTGVVPKFKCNKLCFEIIIIHLFLGNIAECKKLLSKYKALSFGKSKEFEILYKAITAYENYDHEEFTQVISSYDITESWILDLLLKIKEKL